MTEPLVTIVITSYNYARCVGDAISSALGQSYRNLDVLVLDNASTDASLEVISAFHDERLRVVVHPENIGIQRNHNYGIREARGEYVVFLSADDMLLPTLIEDSLAFRRANPEIDIPYFSISVADDAGNVGDYFEHPSFDGADHYRDRNELANLLTRDNCMYMPTCSFRPRSSARWANSMRVSASSSTTSSTYGLRPPGSALRSSANRRRSSACTAIIAAA